MSLFLFAKLILPYLVAKSCAKTLLLFFRLPPGYPRKKAARFFMPDGFLRNVI